MENNADGYKPGEEFEEDTDEPLVDFALTDSTELWLIQWPVKEFKPSDFHGKEVKFKLHSDGKLGCLDTSSGKSYDMVSFAAQAPDAFVFLPTSSESKVAGKFSRRVCLRRYPEPEVFEQCHFVNPNLTSQQGRSSSHRSTVMRSTCDTFALTESRESPERSGKKRREDQRSVERSSHGSRPESHVTDTSLTSEKSKGEKLKKKKKKKKIVDEE